MFTVAKLKEENSQCRDSFLKAGEQVSLIDESFEKIIEACLVQSDSNVPFSGTIRANKADFDGIVPVFGTLPTLKKQITYFELEP